MPIDEEVKSRKVLVNYFQAGETPCEEHFQDLIKSFIHHEEDGVTICKYDTAVDECDVEEVSDIKLEAKTSDYLAYTRLHLDGENSTASIVTGASDEMGTGDVWDNGQFGTGIDLDSNEPDGLIWMKAGKVLIERDLCVKDNADIEDNLRVGIDATINHDLFVGNDATVEQNLQVNNNADVANVLTVGPGATGTEDHLIVHGNACINGDLKVTGDMIVENTTEYNKVVLGDEKADEVEIQGVVNAGDDQNVICFQSPISLRGGVDGTGPSPVKTGYGELFLGEGVTDNNKFLRIKDNTLEIGHSNGNCDDENYDHNPQLTLDHLGAVYITSADINTLPALPGSAMYHLYVDGNARVNGDIYLEDGTGNSAGVLVGVNDSDLCDTSYVEWVPTSGLICDYLNINHAAINGSCAEDFSAADLTICGDVSMTFPDTNDPHTNEIIMSYRGTVGYGEKCITADNGLLLFGTKTDPVGNCDKHIAFTETGNVWIQPDWNNLPATNYALWVGGDTNINGKLDVLDLCVNGEDIDDLLEKAKNTVPVTSVSLLAGVGLPEYSEVPIDEIASITIELAESIEVKDDQERYAYVLLELDAIPRTALNSFFLYTLSLNQVASLGDEYLILKTELPPSRTNPNNVEMTVPMAVIDELKSTLFKRTRMHVILEGKQFGVGTGAKEYDDYNFSLWITAQQEALDDIGSGGSQDDDMNLPAGIALIGSDRIVVTDEALRKAQAYKVADGSPSTRYGEYPAEHNDVFSAFNLQGSNSVEAPFVTGIQLIGTNFAILDSNEEGVAFIDPDGAYLFRYDIQGHGPGFTGTAADFAMDTVKTTAVVDSSQGLINVYDDAGDFLVSFTTVGSNPGYFQVKVIDLFDHYFVYYPSVAAQATTVVEEFDQAGNHLGTNLVDNSLGMMCSTTSQAFIMRIDGLYEYTSAGLGNRVITAPSTENVFTSLAANDNWAFISGGFNSDKIFSGDLGSGGTFTQLSFSGFSIPPSNISTMEVDGSDNVVFAANSNTQGQSFQNALYKIDKVGTKLPFLENYLLGDEILIRPTDVATNDANEVHVLDGELSMVKVFDENGAFIRSFGEDGSADGQFENAQFIEIDRNGYIYILETSLRRIQRFTPDGIHDYTWNGTHANTPFSDPVSMAIDRGGFRLYVLDRRSLKVHTLDLTGPPDSSWLGSPWDAPFDLSNGMTVGIHGHVFIHDSLHRNIQVYRNDGTHITSIGGRQQGSRNITISVGMAFEPGTDRLYVTNPEAATVHVFDVGNIPA